jgi:hypothetical protein
MSPSSIRQPGDVVNEVYSQNIKAIIEMCFEAGDDPTSLIEETKHELQVTENRIFEKRKYRNYLENGC